MEICFRSRKPPTCAVIHSVLHQSQVRVTTMNIDVHLSLFHFYPLLTLHQPFSYFTVFSLPFKTIVIFPSKCVRYDGIQLWDLRLEPGMHDFVWWSSLVSFLFLYPSTFNLLEVSILFTLMLIVIGHSCPHIQHF